MLALTTNLAQYTFHKCAARRARSHLGRCWPAYLVLLSAPLICADLVRHILQDSELWPSPGSGMYVETCCDRIGNCHGLKGMRCLSWVGVVFTILCTYSGFVCMIVGVVFAVDLPKKVRKEWRRIRGLRGK
mmetsp:Transcript_17332/g.48750  ORF Transcript_17332/g.48750 Transcript_17332/m.48750 type:complete len:131 (+) Transcript_17332:334-726(+)